MFSVGMAVYDDFSGVYFTAMNLLSFHKDYIDELVIVDNNPMGKHGETLRQFCNGHAKLRYHSYADVVGTAAPRNKVFDFAKSEYVVCVDSHIVLQPNALQALAEFIKANPGTDDLMQGPLMYDNGIALSTHFSDEWRGGMWGTWDTDERVYSEKWFEIPAQGLGLFAAKRDSWLRFNEAFTGFGGEEWYIHEKYRQAGRKTWCVSGLTWMHRFTRPDGVPYPLHNFDRVRNYFIGLRELNIPTDRMEAHFRPLLSESEMNGARDGKTRAQCSVCGQVRNGYKNAQEWADAAAKEPSDINEHVGTLRDLASKAGVVVDCGMRHNVSTVALASGAKHLHVVAINEPGEVKRLKELRTPVSFIAGDSLTADIPTCNMLFIDTIHTGLHLLKELTKLHERVTRYIVLHDTVTFGETGEDGQPGLMHAVRAFLMAHPQWTVVNHYTNNHGLLVMSRSQEDKKAIPSKAKMAQKFAAMVALHVINNPNEVNSEVYEERIGACSVCELRNDDRCGMCGCPVKDKAKLAGESCPANRWLAVSAQPSIVRRSRWHFLRSVLRLSLTKIMTGLKSLSFSTITRRKH